MSVQTSATVVYKYNLARTPGEWLDLSLPVGAEILRVEQQFHRTFHRTQMWALVDPAAPKVTRRFILAMTGDPIVGQRGHLKHWGTIFVEEFVLHAFEDVT